MTAERCERTELLVAQCAHCKGQVSVEGQMRVLRQKLLAHPAWFPAQYAGTCGQCGERFAVGAAIRSPGPGRLGWVAECCDDEEGAG